ncbi:MAG: hypothetical protein JSR60_04185 [Proteobacteria bacterium]|nr:hypothetical protein [Pseudomonadota bacterium]
MGRNESLFVTQIYQADLPGAAARNRALKRACLVIAADDKAGQRWAKEHRYRGYTSYASLDDLPLRAPEFAELVKLTDGHVARFARQLDFDLGRRRLKLNSLWINVMASGGIHAGHIHPHSAISGTYYVELPKGASPIRFEDPRLPLSMSAPPKKSNAKRPNRPFVTLEPKAGTLLLWESWLRHEVPQNDARGARISVSFNYS